MDPCLCSFYGSAEKWKMCSKCYRNFIKLLHQETVDVVAAAIGSASSGDVVQGGAKRSKRALRCKSCRKKIGVLGFECRCGDIFCGLHRYPKVHSCCKVSDYKVIGRQALAKQNPICNGDKLRERI